MNIFSLVNRIPAPVTPYNPNHHIAEPTLSRTQHIGQPSKSLASPVSMSNKIALTTSQNRPKKFTNFSLFVSFHPASVIRHRSSVLVSFQALCFRNGIGRQCSGKVRSGRRARLNRSYFQLPASIPSSTTTNQFLHVLNPLSSVIPHPSSLIPLWHLVILSKKSFKNPCPLCHK